LELKSKPCKIVFIKLKDIFNMKKFIPVILLFIIMTGSSFSVQPGASAYRGSHVLPRISFKKNAYEINVKDFGARGDGKANDAPAINKAIAAAAASGGGKVIVPAGTYTCGSIHLKSNINLVLAPGAVLQAIADTKVYDAAEPNQWDQYQDYGHSHWHNGFIWGENLENVSITGTGMIYGKGLTRNVARDSLPKGLGDKAISLKNCHNILLRDFSILHGGHFGILATGVDNFTIDNLKIDTNRDGMDIDCCHNVKISNCSVNSPWDDGICLKSSFALGYARATEDVAITNCIVSGFLEGTMLDDSYKPMPQDKNGHPTGRIKLGTESNGGYKNISISNCVFDHCRGLAIEEVDGGLLEDVSVSNITMRNVNNAPIFLRLGSRMRGPKGMPIGKLRRVNISDVVVYNADKATGSIISGIPGHDIEDVKISNIRILYEGGGTKDQASIQPPEKERGYPDPKMFGTLPSYGFYIRHTSGIELTNIKISYDSKEERSPFQLDDVKEADFRFIKAAHETGTPMFVLKGVSNFNIHQSPPQKDIYLQDAEDKTL
jgi:polygalacturonase